MVFAIFVKFTDISCIVSICSLLLRSLYDMRDAAISSALNCSFSA